MSKELEIFKEMERSYLYGNGGDLWLELKAKSELVKQALTKLDKLKRLLTLMSYHCTVELKETSVEKSAKYIEYKEEIQEFKKLFYEFKERWYE